MAALCLFLTLASHFPFLVLRNSISDLRETADVKCRKAELPAAAANTVLIP